MNPRPLRSGYVAAIPFIACFAVACSEAPESRSTPPEVSDAVAADSGTTATPSTTPELQATLDRWRAKLPEGALMRRGACPFECCVYGEWRAESAIPLVPRPAETPSAGSSTLEPGAAFQADSGHVRVTGLALVAVTEWVAPMPQRRLEPGDTLVLLDYVGEGFHSAWLDGEFVEVSDFWSSATDRPRGEVIGEHSSEWWVHATSSSGTSGWFRADAPGVEIAGADACGGGPV